jgi:tyrosyl-tRNA synthetase
MKINTDPKKIDEILSRGTEDIIEKKHLKEELLSGRRLNIKFGIDPTGPKIHLGRATLLLKLKDFQELGHKIILIIGDFTAQIGDASDKDALRKPLTEAEIKKNLEDYLPQIGKVLDLEKTEVYYNSKWLSVLKLSTLVSLTMNFTAQQMIQRRNFKERWDSQKPIGVHEMFYPIFQGYDSVAVSADLELGGFDQLFNLKTGPEVVGAPYQPGVGPIHRAWRDPAGQSAQGRLGLHEREEPAGTPEPQAGSRIVDA